MRAALARSVCFFKCLIFLSAFCAPLLLPASNVIDSLYQVAQTSPNQEERIDAYREIMHYAIEYSDDRMEQFAEECMEYCTSVGSDRGMGYAYRFLASYHAHQGRFEDALENGEKALPFFTKAGITTHHAMTLFTMSAIYAYLGQQDKRKEYCEKGVTIAERGKENWVKAAGYGTMANIYELEGELLKALEFAEKAVVIFEAEKEENYHDLIVGLNIKTRLLRALGRYEEAEETALRAIAVAEKNGLSKVLSECYKELRDHFIQVGQYRKALELTYQQVGAAEKSGGANDLVTAYNSAGDFHNKLGNADEAMRYFGKAFDVAQKSGIPDALTLAYFHIGKLHLKAGEVGKALGLFRKGTAVPNTSDYTLADVLPTLAEAYLEKEMPDSAWQVLQMAEDLISEEDAFTTNRIEMDKANYYLYVGKVEMARQSGEKALLFAKENGLAEQVLRGVKLLDQVYRKVGNFQKALTYSDEAILLEDSLNNDQLKKRVTVLEMQSQFEKEKELLALEQQQKEALLQAKAKQGRTIAFAVGALALLGFGFFWNARRKNQVIAAQNHQLEQLNQTKDRIFSIIGHDLRKPAIAFRGIAKKVNYLLKKQDYATLERLGNEIESDALALNQLTDNLLNWALTQKNVMPYNPVAFKIADMVTDELAIFQKVAAEKKVELVSDVPADMSVFADINALRVIVRNLIDNAIKFTPKDGRVEIVAEEGAEGVKIVVRDTGLGMASEKLNDIFLLREGKSEKGTAGEKGAGLGLHLVSELVQLNRGAIEVASRLGQGTSFEVRMPGAA